MVQNWLRSSLIALFVAIAPACFASGGGSGQYASTVQAPTGVGPSSLQITNSSNEAVYYIHMSPTAQSTWGPDLLGSSVLQIGQTFTISNIAPGQWDLRVVDQSRNYKEWRGAVFEAGGVYNVQVGSGGWTHD
jgi:hypothetical protein